MTPDPYARDTFHGKTLDNATIQALKVAEQRLGYELTIIQGIGGAKASGGTHLEGRAVDLTANDRERKVRVLQDVGFAVWYRADLPGVWGEHIHAILIFDTVTNAKGVAPAGFRQIAMYLNRRDGLVSNLPDANTYRPSPVKVFTLKDYRQSFKEPKMAKTNIQRARNRLTEAIHAAGQAAALLDDADPSRVVARDQRDEIRAAKRELTAVLERMPKR